MSNYIIMAVLFYHRRILKYQDDKLNNFLRMLNVSIPHESFDNINSYALILIDQERNLVEAGLNL